MPTPAQLAEIATDLYGDHGFSTSGYEYKDGLTMDKTKSYVSILDAVYGDSVSGRPSGEFAICSGQESDGGTAYARAFISDGTSARAAFTRSSNALAVCISHLKDSVLFLARRVGKAIACPPIRNEQSFGVPIDFMAD